MIMVNTSTDPPFWSTRSRLAPRLLVVLLRLRSGTYAVQGKGRVDLAEVKTDVAGAVR
jgi:hypothetical protein